VCKECPNFVTCNGGASFDVRVGYWRPADNSTSIYECLTVEACKGEKGTECELGYKGPLCNECAGYIDEKFYSRTGSFECAECPEKN